MPAGPGRAGAGRERARSRLSAAPAAAPAGLVKLCKDTPFFFFQGVSSPGRKRGTFTTPVTLPPVKYRNNSLVSRCFLVLSQRQRKQVLRISSFSLLICCHLTVSVTCNTHRDTKPPNQKTLYLQCRLAAFMSGCFYQSHIVRIIRPMTICQRAHETYPVS